MSLSEDISFTCTDKNYLERNEILEKDIDDINIMCEYIEKNSYKIPDLLVIYYIFMSTVLYYNLLINVRIFLFIYFILQTNLGVKISN